MNKKTLITILITIVVILAISTVYFVTTNRHAITSNPVQNTTEKASTVSPENYIVTAGTTLTGGVLHQTDFSVYKADGTLVKKINLPSDAVSLGADSNGVYGSKIYYLSGSSEATSISEIDPLTGDHSVFAFTQTKNTNTGNELYAIIAWAVSPDNKQVAWINTDDTLHVANRDGSNQENYPITGDVGLAWVGFSQDSSSLYVWRQMASEALEELNIKDGTFNAIVKNQKEEFLISPSGRYLVYSNFDTPLAIRGLTNGKDTAITMSDTGEGFYFYSFSPDESKLYFGVNHIQVGTDYYSVQTDGKNLSKIDDPRLQASISFLPDNSAITQCGEATCLVDLSTTKQPVKISDESFVGSFKL